MSKLTKENKIEIYNSIDEIPNLGIIKNNSIETYFGKFQK